MSEINVTGLKELQAFLDTLPAKVEANIMRGALRAGAKVIESEAKANVPVKAGVLRDSIRVTGRLKGHTVTASIKAGGKTKSGDAFYARFVEYGTAAHVINGRNRGWLSWGGLFAKSVDHPGAVPHPFLRPALDDKADAAITATAEYIKKRLTKEGINVPDTGITIEDEE